MAVTVSVIARSARTTPRLSADLCPSTPLPAAGPPAYAPHSSARHKTRMHFLKPPLSSTLDESPNQALCPSVPRQIGVMGISAAAPLIVTEPSQIPRLYVWQARAPARTRARLGTSSATLPVVPARARFHARCHVCSMLFLLLLSVSPDPLYHPCALTLLSLPLFDLCRCPSGSSSPSPGSGSSGTNPTSARPPPPPPSSGTSARLSG